MASTASKGEYDHGYQKGRPGARDRACRRASHRRLAAHRQRRPGQYPHRLVDHAGPPHPGALQQARHPQALRQELHRRADPLPRQLPQITAMAANEIDMAAFGPLVLALAVNNARLDVKVVADIIQDGVDGYHSETFLVRADSGIDKIEDMKGKRIGTNAIGSASDTAIRAMFRAKGMRDKRDFTMVEVAFPNIPPMIDEGKLDLGTVLQPMSKQLIASGKYKVLFTSKDAMGPSQLVFLTANGKFLEANRTALMDFFEDHVRAVRWFTDPKNRTEAVKIIADFMQQSPDTLTHLFTKEDYFRDPFMIPNVKAIQESIDIAVELGLSPTGITVDPNYVDLSFVEEAKRRIEAGAQ
ncbi:ABC transporter substrate-binding protein [Ancylobacter dichloromethanicus]